VKNAFRKLLSVLMATVLLAGILPAITAQALENRNTPAAYEDYPGNPVGPHQDEGGGIPPPPTPIPVGGGGGTAASNVEASFAYVVMTGVALESFGVETGVAQLVLASGDTVTVTINNGRAGTGIPEYVVGADSTDPSRIVTYNVDDSGRYTLFPVSPDYAVTPQDGAFRTNQGVPQLSWAPNSYATNGNTLYIVRTGSSDYSYTTYTDFREAPTMGGGQDARGIVVHSGSLASVVYVESPTVGEVHSDLIFLGADVGAEDKEATPDGSYYLARVAYLNGIYMPDGLKLDNEYKLGLYAGLSIGADGIAALGYPVTMHTARVRFTNGVIQIYGGYYAGAYVPGPDIDIYTFETDGGYLEVADLSFLPTTGGVSLTFYMTVSSGAYITNMYIVDDANFNPGWWRLLEIGPVFPDGFKTVYEYGDIFDLTGLKVIGTYLDDDANFSEIELTGFTVSPPHGTVLRCAHEDENEIFTVHINYSEGSSFWGLVEKSFSFQIEVAPCKHSAGEDGEETTPATCTQAGETTVHCKMCEAALRTEQIDALGHEWGDGAVTTSAIVGRAGVMTYTCERCGETTTEDIPALTSQGTNSGQQTAPTPTPTPAEIEEIEDEGPPLDEAPNPFEDVAPDAWYYDNVMYAYRQGLMNGTNDSPALFSPNAPTTRGMIVTILYRLSDSPDAEDLPNPFDDVEEGAWYADAVKWAAENGIVSGYGGGKFGPKDNITREQLAVILDNFALFAGLDLPAENEYAGFADDGAISGYAKGAVERLYEAGIIGGKQGNAFDPRGNATRAEVAAMLTRLITATGE